MKYPHNISVYIHYSLVKSLYNDETQGLKWTHWTSEFLSLQTLAYSELSSTSNVGVSDLGRSQRCKDRSLKFQMLCKGSWIITRINSKQKMHPKRSKKWAWSWSLACALDSRPTVAFGTVAARIPVGSLLWLVWHRDRIKGDNGAWSVDIWVSSKWGTQKPWKNWDAENQKIVNCWHIPWVKNILRQTHLPNQLNGQNLIGMPVLFPQFGMNPFLFINTRSPGRCWIYSFWGPRIIVWGWDIQSNWFGSTPTLGFGAAVASAIQGYHSRSSTCCQKSHPSKVILEDLEVRAPPFSHLHNWWLPHKDQPGFSEAKLSWGGISSYPNVWEVQCSMIIFLVSTYIWVCLKMGYTPNYSHLVGIMIINHWV